MSGSIGTGGNVATLGAEQGFPIETPVEGQGVDRTVARWMRWRHWELTAYLVLMVAALVLRLWDLGAQAIHHDESLHAVYSWYITEDRGYIHNPLMHGPFQFFGTSFFYSIFGSSDATARLLSVVFGVALVGLPVLLRSHLGRTGALFTSLLLVFSPTMLYFSRFARNDIFMAVWTLALVGFMWRYFDTRKARYLVLSAMALAFAYSTKETTFILIAVLGSYLLIRAATDVLPWLVGRKRLSRFSPEGEYLILVATVTLPLLAAAISIFQGPLGLTLANGDPSAAAVGIPIGTGLYVAFLTTVVLLVIAAVVGLRWRPRMWLACFGAFGAVWVSLHINVPAVSYDLVRGDIGLGALNLGGIGSGIWQSLGYWIQQHEVCRGCQPWYYYFVIGFNYEFLAMILAVPAMVIYARRGDAFSRFLVYWAVFNFALYTFAGEKMPWLLVEVSLPFLVLAGKFLGELLHRGLFTRAEEPVPVQATEVSEEADAEVQETTVAETDVSKRQRIWVALGVVSMVPLLLVVSGRMLSRFLEPDFAADSSSKWAPLVLLLILAVSVIYFLSITERYRRVALLTLGLTAAMFGLSVTGAFRLAYSNSDVPVEMLVYTQTAPDIPAIMRDIERLSETTGKGKSLRITVDSTDGFSWPWAWYLRDYPLVSYPCLSNDNGCAELDGPPDADVVLLAARNRHLASEHLSEYEGPAQYKHRWWFPESYRGLDPATIFSSIQERESWRRVVDYFLFRDFPEGRLGSIDGLAYFPKDFDTTAVQ